MQFSAGYLLCQILQLGHWQVTVLTVVGLLEVEFLLFSFCHLVIILSKYTLRSVARRVQPCHNPLLISACFDSLELNFINIVFCVYMSTTAFNNVSGIFTYFKI